MYLLKCPSVILRDPILENNLMTRYATNGVIPAISHTSVNIIIVKRRKAIEQRWVSFAVLLFGYLWWEQRLTEVAEEH